MSRKVPQSRLRGSKPVNINWRSWSRGLNSLFAPTKIRDDELSVANNIIFEDEGTPIKRPGTADWATSGGGNTTQGMFPYYKSDGTRLIAKVEDGIFKTWDGTAWAIYSYMTFATNAQMDAAIINDVLYMVNGTNPLTKFDGTTLTRYNLISAPTSSWGTRGASLASGQYAYTYRITAVSADETGETNPTTAFTIYVNKQRDQWNPANQTLSENYSILVNWTAVTGAKGYNIYGVRSGDERFIEYVEGQTVTSWRDLGTKTISQVFALPIGNGTTGPKGTIISAFKSSLLIAGDTSEPSRVYFSAGVDKPDSFLIGDGGGYIDVNKNSDDGIVTGLGTFQNKAIVAKERSMWSMDFTSDVIPSLSNVVQGIGCVSQHTLIPVENDLFFMGRKPGGGAALYVLGNEPNYFDVLRTNEISSRVRPTLAALSGKNFKTSYASYFNGRYMLFFASGGVSKNNAVLVYDRERLGFSFWNDGVNGKYPITYYDANGQEYQLYADENDNRITRIDESYTTDKGDAIMWTYKTKESDLGNPFIYKRYKWVNIRLRAVDGNVRTKIWTDSTIIAHTSLLQATQGANIKTIFGSGQFGIAKFGSTIDGGVTKEEDAITRRLPIGRQGVNSIARSIALEVYGTESTSKAALLDVQVKGRLKSENYYPRDEVTN